MADHDLPFPVGDGSVWFWRLRSWEVGHAIHTIEPEGNVQAWLRAASETCSPAILVCHIRRGSVMS